MRAAHFCQSCGKVQPPMPADYFAFFGLDRKLNLDVSALEKEFYQLSRNLHPDLHAQMSPEEQAWSLEQSSLLNDAYRTLRDPITRLQYLLQIEGLAAAGPAEATRQVPPALLEEVFALNEQLDEIRDLRAGGAPDEAWQARLTAARQPIEAKRAEHEAQLQALAARWDADGGADVLAALRDRFLERSYIHNLLEGIERESQSTL